MKTLLIEALKKTIEDLKSGREFYEWTQVDNCNCGILARNITGLKHMCTYVVQGTWRKTASLCKQTGAPINVVFEKLHEAGLSNDDIGELEMLGNAEILKEAGLDAPRLHSENNYPYTIGNGKKENVIKYMEAWVRILEKEKPPIEAAQVKPMGFITRKDIEYLLIEN